MATATMKKRRSGNPAGGVFAPAVRDTIEYAARIHEKPTACPMFPAIDEDNGAVETICYMQGYLAGCIASTGKRPTRREMEALRHDVLHDPKVRDIVVGMQRPMDLDDEDDAWPREF